MAKNPSIDDGLVGAESADDSSVRTGILHNWKKWIAEQIRKRKQIVEKKNAERRERNAERIKKIGKTSNEIAIATGRPTDLYDERKKYLQSIHKYRSDDPRAIKARERYAAIRDESARAVYGSIWADDEYAAFLKSYHEHGKESPLTKEAYETWVEAAIKIHHETTIWETPPPKHPELEETRGPITSALLTTESAAGTAIYNLRKRLGFKPIDWIEQTESDEALKEISPSQALGLTTRETSLLTWRGIAGLGIDIWLDPLTYIKFFSKLVGKGLEIVNSEGKTVTINEKGIEILERQTKGIREHFGVSADEARKAAENLVVDLTRHRKEILAARKYQEPTFSIGGHVLWYWSSWGQTGKKVWEGAPLYKQRASTAHWLRETFEPYYKVTQAAGKHAGDVFAEQVRKYEYGRSKWSKAARDLSKKYPRWFRKKEIISLDEQVAEYIERGIAPTDPRAYVIAEDMVVAQNAMAEQEIAEGILKREQFRKGYVFHVFTKEFKEEVLAKKYGYKKGEDPLVYLRKLESAHPREMQGSIKQINEWAMEEYGMKALETNLPRILELRGIESVRAITASELRRRVGIELGVPAEQVSPISSRMHPKYTPAQINEILDKKYGGKIETLRETLGIPEEAEINTAEDVMRYITPKPVAPLTVSFETPEDVMQYLERGRGVDITDLRAVPAKETKVAKIARERADRYERRLKPFYRFLDDIKAGKIRPTTVQNVEEAMAAENRGMFAGVRISGMPEFMEEDTLRWAKEYRRYEDEISELESDIIKYRREMERTPSMASEYSNEIAGHEKEIAHKRERQANLIKHLQEKTSSIKREIIEPSERKIAHQRHIAGMGITAPIEWGAGLPTDISRMPATMSPIDWAIRSTEQSASQKQIGDASETLITTIKKRDIDLKNLQFAKSAPGALPEKVFVNGKWLVRHKYTLTTGETRVSYVDEAVEEELGR
ncbi:MAG: hypothetical protein GWP10_06570, partial [Nitrospiraceae bacterium]|nr:hypothetical protein [Nitrospiraceae bacterium]